MSFKFLGDHSLEWEPQIDSGQPHARVIFSSDRQIWVAENQLLHPGAAQAGDILVGTVGEFTLWVCQNDAPDLPGSFMPLRPAVRNAPSDHQFVAASAAIQRLEFVLEHKFCGRCGSPTSSNPGDSGVRCNNAECATVFYPRIAPSVIVLVTRGEECLLARSPRFEPGMYSTLAGFLEAGESAEHAIRREIREEVGIEVKNPQYFATQSWPFKHSLMMGYFAEWAGGDIQVDGVEIVDAQWFTRENLPELPLSASISRALIDTWLAGRDR